MAKETAKAVAFQNLLKFIKNNLDIFSWILVHYLINSQRFLRILAQLNVV
jgi:hypothetical protein